MESYLVREDMWDVVNGSNTTCLEVAADNLDNLKKWKQLNERLSLS